MFPICHSDGEIPPDTSRLPSLLRSQSPCGGDSNFYRTSCCSSIREPAGLGEYGYWYLSLLRNAVVRKDQARRIHERGGSSCQGIPAGSKRAVNAPDPIFRKNSEAKELLLGRRLFASSTHVAQAGSRCWVDLGAKHACYNIAPIQFDRFALALLQVSSLRYILNSRP
jgi:hypothetical protein